MRRKSKSTWSYLGYRLWWRNGTAYVCWNRPGGSTGKRSLDTSDVQEAKELLIQFADRNAHLDETGVHPVWPDRARVGLSTEFAELGG